MIGKYINRQLLTSMLALTIIFFSGCSSDGGSDGGKVVSKKEGDNTVVLHELSDPDFLNPFISSAANSTYIELNIFQQLLAIDFKTLELVGSLAVGRPEIKEVEEGEYAGGMSLAYEIRPEATWDDGTPIIAEDYIFSIKIIKNPKVNAGSVRSYIAFIDDIVVDADNPKKFTIYSKERYILAEVFSGYYVYQPKAYDPEGLMSKFTLKEMSDPKFDANAHPELQQFADAFNSSKYAREVGFVQGSGPYEFKGWETGQRITLERKKDWWGDKVKDAPQLAANPDKLVYKIQNDWTTAVTDMKDEGMDVARGVRSGDFVDLKDNARFTQLYNLHNPTQLSYDYIGFNMKNPKLNDKRVRRAIAHLVNKDQIIKVLLKGLGEPVIGPIHPTKPYYNKNLKNIEYNVDKAKELLAEAGWTDTNGNGIVDKEIDGELTEMKLEYKYNSGNDRRKNTGILLKENAKRAGIEIDVVTREWTVFLEDTKKRDFELYCAGWVQSPIPDDLTQIWHTESDHPDGDNRVGFGNAESDQVIDEIRVTLDPLKQKDLYYRIQEIIYEEQPYVFLVSPKERIVIHNRFDNAEPSVNRPGYNQNAFTLRPATQVADKQ